MIFLEEDDIKLIHSDVITKYGGKRGIRDENLLRSAIAQPQQSFGGTFVHSSIFEKGAAYFFHLCQNHPFVDGNKRVGLVAALVFLKINGYSIDFSPEQLEQLTWSVADGKSNKDEIANFLSQIIF